MSDLSHVDETGGVRMVDVGAKPLSKRRATARATVLMAAATATRLRTLPKGDALATAQLAGIMASRSELQQIVTESKPRSSCRKGTALRKTLP